MSISRKLAASVRSRRREMLDFVRDLIALPTENPPGTAYRECVHLLRKRLRELRLPVDFHGPQEFVPVRNIENCALIYALTAVRLLGDA
jgi:acetylornithine deacetylase/succinyl-diaminopimelate desuccinylase-like protein